MKEPNFPVHELDPLTVAIELEVPAKEVVLLQAYFELYEGLGTVRTAAEKGAEPGRQAVQVITTRDQVALAQEALRDISRLW